VLNSNCAKFRAQAPIFVDRHLDIDTLMPTVDPLILDTFSRLFTEQCSPAVVNAAEEGKWPVELWTAIETAGLSLAWVPEKHGGADGSLADGFAISRVAAAHAVPVPLAETLLAGWLLAEAGLNCPIGPMSVSTTVLTLDSEQRLSGSAKRIPFAAKSEHLAVLASTQRDSVCVVLVPCSDLNINPHPNLAGEMAADVSFTNSIPTTVINCRPDQSARLRQMGAVMRSQQIAGALAHVLDQCIEYASDRQQFGRPIGRFQAVQHNLAILAGEAAAASSAADAAVRAMEQHGLDDPRAQIAIASAKVRAGEAAGAGAAIAHQVHGAMGYTHEYSLQHYTRRLWSWRDDFGSESVWAVQLGNQVAAAGHQSLWPLLSDF
jgi:alkylation response protein AidB-like acyl-CoA dehydrogenase